MTTETLLEITASASLSVNRTRGIIHGVKILGLDSSNGNSYSRATIERAKGLYENIRVNVNHPPKGKEGQARDYRDRIGRLQNIVVRDGGLYGDLHYNPRHELAEQLAWDAENSPRSVGLSHNAEGKGTRQNGKFIVEEIKSVRSVDLVGDPATTGGLFESEQTKQIEEQAIPDDPVAFGRLLEGRLPKDEDFAKRLLS